MLELTDICFSYKNQKIFDHFSLSVSSEQILCILGVSGVGKSSLLRIIAGLESVYSGQMIFDYPHPRIAYLSQQNMLLPWLTVLENLVVGAKLRKEAPPYERARALLDHIGLGMYAEAMPHTLSGGMQQRIAVLRILLEDNDLILLDEPFSAVDVVTRYELQNFAVECFARKTVVWVTHDPMEALRVADRIIVLADKPANIVAVQDFSEKAPRELAEGHYWQYYQTLFSRLKQNDVCTTN